MKRTGAAAAELAMLLPLLAFLALVVVDYSRVFFVTQTVENSAYAGAMYASNAAPHPNDPIVIVPSPPVVLDAGGILEDPSGEGLVDSEDALTRGLEDLEESLHLRQVDPVVQAVLAEGASLNPPLEPKNVSVSYTTTTATVTVIYKFNTITSYLPGGQQVQLVRTAKVPIIPKAGE